MSPKPTTNTSDLSRLAADLTNAVRSNVNMPAEVADVLGLSRESVYRKLRGDAPFLVAEITALAQAYDLDLSYFVRPKSGLLFDFHGLYENESNILDYLQDINKRVNDLQKLTDPSVVMTCADIPLFRLFKYETLARFKCHYWSSLLDSGQTDEYFDVTSYTAEWEVIKSTSRQFSQYCKDEFWSINTLQGTIAQIEYYKDCNLLSIDTANLLYSNLLDLLEDLFDQDENSTLYFYELAFNSNTFFVESAKECTLSVATNSINSVTSSDKACIQEHLRWLDVVRQRSYKVSGQSTKNRLKLMNGFVLQLRKPAINNA